MPYMDEFNSIVTLSKRNHRYYGPTESQKIKGALTEISTDFNTIFYEINEIKSNIDILASGYLLPSGALNSLYDLNREIYNLEKRLENRIYTKAYQAELLE